ncbi:unnamed protein product [Gadus morhua 'NCC']
MEEDRETVYQDTYLLREMEEDRETVYQDTYLLREMEEDRETVYQDTYLLREMEDDRETVYQDTYLLREMEEDRETVYQDTYLLREMEEDRETVYQDTYLLREMEEDRETVYQDTYLLREMEHLQVTIQALTLLSPPLSPVSPVSPQHLQVTIQALQDELHIQRDLNQLLNTDYGEGGGLGEMTEDNFLRLHSDYERQAKELFLLRKTLEEMELRIDTQKHTLNARDESIKKLLEMLQSKGLSSRATEEDHELTRRLADAEMTIHHLEGLLEQKDKETLQLRETSVLDLKEKASSLASGTLQRDSRLKSLEIHLEHKKEECLQLDGQLRKAQSCTLESQANQQLAERISCLEQEVTRHQEEAGRAQQEVERLLDILREMENEKNDKDKKIHDLERHPPPTHLWRSQPPREQAPPPTSSQPMGELVWDYLGT